MTVRPLWVGENPLPNSADAMGYFSIVGGWSAIRHQFPAALEGGLLTQRELSRVDFAPGATRDEVSNQRAQPAKTDREACGLCTL